MSKPVLVAALVLMALAGEVVRAGPDPAALALNPGGRQLTLPVAEAGHQLLPLVRTPHPLPALSGARSARLAADISLGRALFQRDWLIETPSGARPKAGPHYDRSTCAGCHVEAQMPEAPGAAPLLAAAGGVGTPRADAYLVARVLEPADIARLGEQANTRRVGPLPPETTVEIAWDVSSFRYPDGRVRRLRSPRPLARDANGRPVPVALRSAPLLFGWGLLEQVEPSMLQPFHDPHDRDGDGISGRISRVKDPCTGVTRPGLFGWKASQPTLRRQIAAALHNDMGIITAARCGHAEGDADGASEMTDQELEVLTEYVRYLGVPDRRRRGDPQVARGETLFGRLACNACHVPVLRTSLSAPAGLADENLWPYTDLMLHDMGRDLAETADAPLAREWRTAPLWGVGLVEALLPEHGFLHDGRAETLEDAILWHGGEASRSREEFVRLSPEEREAVLAFVRAL